MSSTTQAHRSPALQPNRRHDISLRIRRKQVFLGISLALVAFRALNFVCPPKSLETGGELPEVALCLRHPAGVFTDYWPFWNWNMGNPGMMMQVEATWSHMKPHEATKQPSLLILSSVSCYNARSAGHSAASAASAAETGESCGSDASCRRGWLHPYDDDQLDSYAADVHCSQQRTAKAHNSYQNTR